jgi:hypothetical protein
MTSFLLILVKTKRINPMDVLKKFNIRMEGERVLDLRYLCEPIDAGAEPLRYLAAHYVRRVKTLREEAIVNVYFYILLVITFYIK